MTQERLSLRETVGVCVRRRSGARETGHRERFAPRGALVAFSLAPRGLARAARAPIAAELARLRLDLLARAVARRRDFAPERLLVLPPDPDRITAVRCAPNLIVNAGENWLVDCWQGTYEPETMKYHGVGTGTTAAAEGDTGLETESTTALNPDSTRATGSLTEGASANVLRTVGTVTFDGSAAITEWGLFNQAATGGGTLWSRVVFAAINVASGDSIQFTYDLTVE